jgi:hypothetical protein
VIVKKQRSIDLLQVEFCLFVIEHTKVALALAFVKELVEGWLLDSMDFWKSCAVWSFTRTSQHTCLLDCFLLYLLIKNCVSVPVIIAESLKPIQNSRNSELSPDEMRFGNTVDFSPPTSFAHQRSYEIAVVSLPNVVVVFLLLFSSITLASSHRLAR